MHGDDTGRPASPDDARRPLDDQAAWHVLGPLLTPYLPWSTGALRPSGLVTVLNEIWFRRPRLVLELGSGMSTIVIARLLRELGTGRLLAVEHDDAWADRVQAQLEREGLADLAAVVRAPLGPHGRSRGDTDWYDEATLAAALDDIGDPVEVLVIDGPPAWRPGTEQARYPALGVLAARLAPGAAVVLDDVERKGEQDVLARWRHEHGLDLDLRPGTGVAVGVWPDKRPGKRPSA